MVTKRYLYKPPLHKSIADEFFLYRQRNNNHCHVMLQWLIVERLWQGGVCRGAHGRLFCRLLCFILYNWKEFHEQLRKYQFKFVLERTGLCYLSKSKHCASLCICKQKRLMGWEARPIINFLTKRLWNQCSSSLRLLRSIHVIVLLVLYLHCNKGLHFLMTPQFKCACVWVRACVHAYSLS